MYNVHPGYKEIKRSLKITQPLLREGPYRSNFI